MKRLAWLFIAGFFVYMGIEVIFGAIFSGSLALEGHTSIWMGFVGGFILILFSIINQSEIVKNKPLWIQALYGAIMITFIEFWSGYLLNIDWELDIWDYSSLPLNICGQVDVIFMVLWFFLAPFAYWADDFLEWIFYKTGYRSKAPNACSLWGFYKRLFK